MIVCHCNVIKRAEIESSIRELLAEDPSACLRPQSVYKMLQKRGKCCGCFPQVESIVETVLKSATADRPLFGLSETRADGKVLSGDGDAGKHKGY